MIKPNHGTDWRGHAPRRLRIWLPGPRTVRRWRDADQHDAAARFLSLLDAVYAQAAFQSLSGKELEARRKGRRVASANNAIEALPTTRADILNEELMDRHGIPTALGLELLGETARLHPSAYARLIAEYG